MARSKPVEETLGVVKVVVVVLGTNTPVIVTAAVVWISSSASSSVHDQDIIGWMRINISDAT